MPRFWAAQSLEYFFVWSYHSKTKQNYKDTTKMLQQTSYPLVLKSYFWPLKELLSLDLSSYPSTASYLCKLQLLKRYS